MNYITLRQTIKQNLFTTLDVLKYFPEESESSIKIQLHRFSNRQLIISIKRGLYCFDLSTIDEMQLANMLYLPSYISLESALHYYGMIPDIPQSVTSINYTTTKIIQTKLGLFSYAKVKQGLFFGFKKIGIVTIANKEKALLDYLYIRKITSLKELRIQLNKFDKNKFSQYAGLFPGWIRNISII